MHLYKNEKEIAATVTTAAKVAWCKEAAFHTMAAQYPFFVLRKPLAQTAHCDTLFVTHREQPVTPQDPFT